MSKKTLSSKGKKSFHSKATCQYGNTFMSYVLLVVGMSKSTVGENSGLRSGGLASLNRMLRNDGSVSLQYLKSISQNNTLVSQEKIPQ